MPSGAKRPPVAARSRSPRATGSSDVVKGEKTAPPKKAIAPRPRSPGAEPATKMKSEGTKTKVVRKARVVKITTKPRKRIRSSESYTSYSSSPPPAPRRVQRVAQRQDGSPGRYVPNCSRSPSPRRDVRARGFGNTFGSALHADRMTDEDRDYQDRWDDDPWMPGYSDGWEAGMGKGWDFDWFWPKGSGKGGDYFGSWPERDGRSKGKGKKGSRSGGGGKGAPQAACSRVHVSNLPPNTKEGSLESLFKKHGHVLGLQLLPNSKGGAPGNICAIIRFASIEDAAASIEALHNKHEVRQGDGPVLVKMAKPNPRWDN